MFFEVKFMECGKHGSAITKARHRVLSSNQDLVERWAAASHSKFDNEDYYCLIKKADDTYLIDEALVVELEQQLEDRKNAYLTEFANTDLRQSCKRLMKSQEERQRTLKYGKKH